MIITDRYPPAMMCGVGEGAWMPDGKTPTAAQLRKRYESSWLLAEQVAEVAGITRKVWVDYVAQRQARAHTVTSRLVGRTRQWEVRSFAEWLANRPGSGRWGER